MSVVIPTDVAVGCPFGGEEHEGRVLIYNGHQDVAAKGLMLSQELRAARSSAGGLSGYGFTLGGGQDLDNNHYPGKYVKHISLCVVPSVLVKILSSCIPSLLHFPFQLLSLHSLSPVFLTSTFHISLHAAPPLQLPSLYIVYSLPPPHFPAKVISQRARVEGRVPAEGYHSH